MSMARFSAAGSLICFMARSISGAPESAAAGEPRSCGAGSVDKIIIAGRGVDVNPHFDKMQRKKRASTVKNIISGPLGGSRKNNSIVTCVIYNLTADDVC